MSKKLRDKFNLSGAIWSLLLHQPKNVKPILYETSTFDLTRMLRD